MQKLIREVKKIRNQILLQRRINNILLTHLDCKFTEDTIIKNLGNELTTLSIIVSLETEFGIEIPDKKIEEFKKISDIYEHFRKFHVYNKYE